MRRFCKQYLFASLLMLCIALMSGCESETRFGRCRGITAVTDTTLVYEPSIRNIVVGVFFSETVIVPVVVVVKEFQCPVERR